jgi:phosphatidate cytidylyltransferase
MNNLLTRTLTGFIFAVVVLGAIFFSPWAVFVVLGGFAIVGLYEFYKLLVPDQPAGILYYFLGISIYVLVALIGMEILDASNYLLIIISFFILIGAEIFHYPAPSWKRITVAFTAFIYIALSMGLMNSLFFIGNAGVEFPWVLLSLFILVWANDVFAYLVGSAFGKHKLFERLSPNKTWEGSIGGFVFTLVFAWGFSLVSAALSLDEWLIMGAIVSVAANIGDLAESLLKRNAGVKDSGSFMPGHGGALDRFDAILFATPFVYFYLSVL